MIELLFRMIDIKRSTPLFFAIFISTQGLAYETNSSDESWVTTWATATEDIREGFWMSEGHFPPVDMTNKTFRMFTRTSIAGSTIRVKFSNAFGHDPVVISTARIAEAASPNTSENNGEINVETDTLLTFSGEPRLILQPGETVYSDAVSFDLSPLEVVAISIHYEDISNRPITGHRGARTSSFFEDGNRVSSHSLNGSVKKDVWYTVTAIEVDAPEARGVIVALGDSITDGYGTKYNYHTRWTDYLAERLTNNPSTKNIGMANVGIGGSGLQMAVERFQYDVTDINGAAWLIIFIGINDIVFGESSADYVLDKHMKIANMARENGLKVLVATITPMGAYSDKNSREEVRQEVNEWIRTTAIQNNFIDGVIDFDKVVSDPERQKFLLPLYAVDDLHLNITGYRALSDAVNLALFEVH